MFQFGLLLFISLWGIQNAAKVLVGPYDIELQKLYKCHTPDNPNNILWTPNVRRYNRTISLFSSNVTFPNGVNDNMQANVDISVLKDGAWRKNFLNFRLNKVCSDVYRLLPKVVISYCAAAGVNFTGCPFKAGVYNVMNWVIDLSVASGVFAYNTYKIEIKLFYLGKQTYCIVLEVGAVPKVKKP